jgi:hypothetical protein
LNLTQGYSGRGPYYADFEAGPHRLVVAVECQIADVSLHALLDTGADWCVLPPSIAEALGYDPTPDPELPPYHTRYGRLFGRQERISVYLLAEGKPSLAVEATWFISPDWPGPAVLGWKGCLERLRFALDPTPGEEWFYFGPIGESPAP